MKTFEDFIRVAIEGGLDIAGLLPKNILGINVFGWFAHDNELSIQYVKKSVSHYYVDYYRLLFGTDIIDRVVGKGAVVFDGTRARVHDADYHRREMANIKDINKLKAYCVGLLERGR